MKNIAILTSGGDCSGMNACIYYAWKYGKANGCKVFGIVNGFKGMLEDTIEELDPKEVINNKYKGGTFLYSARVEDFRKPEVQEIAANNLKKHDIDTLIVCGGDGSFHGAYALSKFGLKMYGIPCTIDNDIFFSDYTIGFASAVAIDTYCINAVKDTMKSHRRIGIVETMGRSNGEIALYAGLRSNADVIMIPEVKTTVEAVAKEINDKLANGQPSAVVVVAEGVMPAKELADALKPLIPGHEVKPTNLGYLQRGGYADEKDVFLAKILFKRLFKLMKQGVYNKCLGVRNDEVIEINVNEIDNYHEHPDFLDMVNLVKVGK